MIFSGTPVNASEALQLGLVEKVYLRACSWKKWKSSRGRSSERSDRPRVRKRAIDNGVGLPLREALEVEIVRGPDKGWPVPGMPKRVSPPFSKGNQSSPERR